MPRFDEGEQNLKLIKGNIVLMGNPDQYGEILAENIFVEDITRAALQTLISGSNLVRGKYYRITNAVGSTLSLVVKAVTADVLDEVAVNSTNGDNVIYNITTDVATVPYADTYVPYTGATSNVNLGEQGITTGYVGYDLTPTNTPTTQGTTYWDSNEETIALIMNGAIQHVGLDTFYNVKNTTGSSIPKGTAVRFAGTDGNSGHLLIAPMLADGTYPSTYYMGITSETIANNDFGKVIEFGKLRGVNTSSYNNGDILYLSTTVAGGFQTTAPIAPNNIIVVAAVVSASNNGTLMVRATLGSNINNDEGVKITSPTNGQLLQLQSNGLWENKTKAQVLGGTSSQFVKGDGTLDSTSYTPTSRQLTINGTTYDLSVNRTWTIPTHDAVTIGTANGLSLLGQQLSLGLSSSSANGALSSTDWSTFNAKQPALNGTGFVKISGTTISYDNSTYLTGNQTITLSGEASGTGATSINVTLDNNSVTGKLLTGLSITGSAVVSTDSILTAVGKLQNQVNALAGGVSYQGTWNASTNSPSLSSGTGTKGYYYVVSVPGSTNLDGITDWKLGDWAIYDGTAWQKVDNTDAVVSVNGYTGIVTLAKADIGLGNVENTALSTWAGSTNITTLGTIGTGVWQGTAIGDTYISSASTWNAKIGGSGTTGKLAKFTSSGAVGDSIVSESLNVIGINQAPSAWSGFINNAIEGRNGSSIAFGFGPLPVMYLNSNAYYNGTDWTYKVNGPAAQYAINNDAGSHLWQSAVSGIAGNLISYVDKMKLTSSELITFGAADTGEAHIFGGSARVNGALLNTTQATFATVSGIVGIGTASPSVGMLHLNYNSVNNRALRLQDENGIYDIITSGGGNNHSLGIYDETNSAYRVYITPSGNVGIGTTSPNAKLDVRTTSSIVQSVSMQSSTALSNLWNDTTPGIELFNTIANSDAIGAGAGIKFYLSTNGNPQAGIFGVRQSTTSSALAFYTQDANFSVLERLRITSTGNVLIGTTSDDNTNKLQVSGSAKVKNNLHITGASGGYTTGDNPIIGLGNTSTSGAFGTIEHPFGDKLTFNMYHGYRFRVSNSGVSPIDALVINIDRSATFSSSVTAQGVNIGVNALGTDRMFQISGNAFTSGTTQFGAVINPSMGTLTNAYGVYASISTTSATNIYGLYIDASAGTNTNKYGIYQAGSSDLNYFAGAATFSSSIAIGNTVTASIATPSTHKVEMVIGGVTYYLLATNV